MNISLETLKDRLPDVENDTLRDAARLAAQSAVASAAMFTIMRLADMPEQFVGVLSAVLVVQPTLGTTLVKASARFLATLCGCVIGIFSFFLLPNGYGTAAALALSMLLMNAIAGFKPAWRYGVVAAVALALGAEEAATQAALDRSLAIGLGVVVGIVSSLVVWPEKASTRAERETRLALSALAEFIDCLMETLENGEEHSCAEEKANYEKRIHEASEAADAVRIADNESLTKRIEATRGLYHAIVILQRVHSECHDLGARDEQLRERLKEVRGQCAGIARALADGKWDEGDPLAEVLESVNEVREIVSSQQEAKGDGILRSALAFAIDEIKDSLRVLAQLYGRAST